MALITVVNWIRKGRTIRGQLLGVRDYRKTGEGALLLDCDGKRMLVRFREPYEVTKLLFVDQPRAIHPSARWLVELTSEGWSLRELGADAPASPPSQCADRRWIYARARSSLQPLENAGKWLLFVPREAIDRWWARVRDAVEKGMLGPSAKVSTLVRDRTAGDPNEDVICVYTCDADDEDDKTRVREALRDIGVNWKIPYKSDRQTRAGQYAGRGLPRLRRE